MYAYVRRLAQLQATYVFIYGDAYVLLLYIQVDILFAHACMYIHKYMHVSIDTKTQNPIKGENIVIYIYMHACTLNHVSDTSIYGLHASMHQSEGPISILCQ